MEKTKKGQTTRRTDLTRRTNLKKTANRLVVDFVLAMDSYLQYSLFRPHTDICHDVVIAPHRTSKLSWTGRIADRNQLQSRHWRKGLAIIRDYVMGLAPIF